LSTVLNVEFKEVKFSFDQSKTKSYLQKRNIPQEKKELIWLTENLAPDFKTITDFRKNNRKTLENLFKKFLELCHKLNLPALKTVAIDER